MKFSGEFTLYTVTSYQNKIDEIDFSQVRKVDFDLEDVVYFDTAASIFINSLIHKLTQKNITSNIITTNKDILDTLELVLKSKKTSQAIPEETRPNFLNIIGENTYLYYSGFVAFMAFIGQLFATKINTLKTIKNIRFKEIAFEINESAIKALGIISLTSFLIGLVVAYQSAYQLKIYGANIFIVDMLGISMLRELAPLMTAIVIAGRSGSAFTAQIGAMKITEELDAMRTMGFDPYIFLVLPRIIALMIAMPILIFVADIMSVFGGLLVAVIDLDISPQLFIDRFNDVVAAKHFFIGIGKGPFFAFIIASIGVYRGLEVKDDTQSIGFNTTKSVVESIFAVIICDAIFSILFTNLGI
ncbi:ABC transporter permease [Sulfurimonas gotlandica]|uniref:ABC transporter permease n=1 Tax=Sulfurimonas gotlandica TaxID=1176482 RepID=UPI000183AFAC|nr:ABC transporter permease [Sulfurimonas gotlandica]EDZ62385.1 stas domain protein [Sulfurimonas gotlandica GD1]